MNNMKKVFFIFSLLFYSLLCAETPVFDFSPVSEENISLVLYDTAAQKTVLTINAEKPFLYASNLKLLTSAAALKHLGGGFKFLTKFSFDPDSGTLHIKAGGDPEGCEAAAGASRRAVRPHDHHRARHAGDHRPAEEGGALVQSSYGRRGAYRGFCGEDLQRLLCEGRHGYGAFRGSAGCTAGLRFYGTIVR